MRRDIRQICLFEPVDCGMSDMSITWSANKGENIAQRVCVERILYNNTAEKTRYLTIEFFTLFYPRLLTLDFLPSTFYPHPRLFTLALDFLPSPSTFNTRHSTNR